MITRLEIDGFKGFEAFDIDLAPLTVIVGGNAAGKSNLFDVVSLLSNLAGKDVAEAVKDMRGEPLELFRQTASGRARRIVLAAEVLVDPMARDPWGSEVELTHTRLRYEVTLERRDMPNGLERIQVAHEAAYPIADADDDWAASMQPSASFRKARLRYKRKAPLLTTDTEAPNGPTFNIHQDGRQGRHRPASAAEATVLYSITNAEFRHLFALREEMRGWRLLQLDPALLRKPAPATVSDVLEADGSNLAAVLVRLKAETSSTSRPAGALADIASELNELVPGVVGLDAQLHEASREYRVELIMRDGLPFSSRVVSDGTLRVLALLTLLHDPRHRGLECFEESENGVHPARIRALVERLQDMVTDPRETLGIEEFQRSMTQLLMNSHSPVVLAAIVQPEWMPAESVVLFADTTTVSDPENGEMRRRTRLRRVRSDSQISLLDPAEYPQAFVSDFEVRKMLETVSGDI